MEIRKVQITGGSSYIISLPKEWIEKRHIEKGDSLGLVPQQDGSLLITDRLGVEEEHATKEINLDDIKNARHLFRVLLACYIMGYSRIIIRSTEDIETSFHNCVIEFTQGVIGPEIIEETSQHIIIKDLLNPAEMPMDKTARRMLVLVQNMMRNTLESIENGDLATAETVIGKDAYINRLHWLVSRQLNMMMRDLGIARKMNVTQQEAIFYYMITRFIERIGDHMVMVARNSMVLIEAGVHDELQPAINTAMGYAMGLVEKSIEAWFKKDLKLAQEILDSFYELVGVCEEISSIKLDCKDVDPSVAQGYIAESIRRMGAYASDISELVIDYIV
ncbi:MAG: PhoU family transcriptional regulator [Candidatus Thorarchaeota archaeon]|nr:MAG: PhoU family transcriptional regulator [Candidatus Thorarchaeota archaeon]